MDIEKQRTGKRLLLNLSGRLDTNTSPLLEREIRQETEGVEELILDMGQLDYISSAGLRVLLSAQKIMNQQGSMRIRNVCKALMEVFRVTGFLGIFTVQPVGEEEGKALCLAAKVENLDQVLAFINRKLEVYHCPDRIMGQIDVAAEEIFVNIAHYAYESGIGDAELRVEVEEDPLRVAITFVDHGIPYDPLSGKDPDISLSADEREIGGLGIFMVKNSMDDVCYEYKDGKNILTIRKELSERH